MSQLSGQDCIIVLDDDPMINRIIAQATSKKTVSFTTVDEMKEKSEGLTPLAIFVDIHLGVKENGLDTLPKLKLRWPFCPIIVITTDRDENSVSKALAAGADDFIYKPLNIKELLARLQVRMAELSKKEAVELVRIGDVTIDLVHRSIASEKKGIRYLSSTEMNLLSCLVHARGTLVRREVLKRKCWGQIFVSDNALNRKLHEVRRALKEVSDQVQIRTLYGTGVTLEFKTEVSSLLDKAG